MGIFASIASLFKAIIAICNSYVAWVRLAEKRESLAIRREILELKYEATVSAANPDVPDARVLLIQAKIQSLAKYIQFLDPEEIHRSAGDADRDSGGMQGSDTGIGGSGDGRTLPSKSPVANRIPKAVIVQE